MGDKVEVDSSAGKGSFGNEEAWGGMEEPAGLEESDREP